MISTQFTGETIITQDVSLIFFFLRKLPHKWFRQGIELEVGRRVSAFGQNCSVGFFVLVFQVSTAVLPYETEHVLPQFEHMEDQNSVC